MQQKCNQKERKKKKILQKFLQLSQCCFFLDKRDTERERERAREEEVNGKK